jgi:hypothetical protein
MIRPVPPMTEHEEAMEATRIGQERIRAGLGPLPPTTRWCARVGKKDGSANVSET